MPTEAPGRAAHGDLPTPHDAPAPGASAARPAHAYHFVTDWRVEADLHEVVSILDDPEGLPRWWPSVYLDVRVLEPGAPGGVGKVVELFTKGFLPYTLRWRFRVAASDKPHGWTIEAGPFGPDAPPSDFVGRGVWSFRQEGPEVAIRYEWTITAEKPLLKRLSPLLKPLFSANHLWAMARGEEALRLELLRRRAPTPEARAAIPAPRPPTFPHRRWHTRPRALPGPLGATG